ncbi:MFS transporter [Sulfurovum sp. bin170]|uniref:MFS transporter n=1 Tax=Sulfurovum sp. bin170 TaxID=2695268 RepID=UPI0013DEE3AE|nr:MFS transporter [Sulfurovum sp. bin170]NEW60970.1 MFS transporter [Sulfurovum sp. bin170]
MKVTLSLFYLFYFALVGVYIIFMPKVLLDFNYSKAQVGIIYAAAPFMRFLLPFLFKHLVELNHKVYLFSLLFTFLATLIFLSTVENFYLYLFANLLFGASMGISLPFVETIALQQISKKEYGRIRLWGSVGFIIIALWLGKILSDPYEALYYLSGTAFMTLVVGYFALQFDSEVKERKKQESDSSFSLTRFWAFWVSLFLMQLAFGGFYNFFTIYEIEHGISLEMVSWMWIFGVVCEIVMLYFQGPLLERNLLNILKIATLITAFRWMILYLYPDSITLTFASQSLHAVSFALYHTATITYVFSLYSQKKLAQQFLLGIGFGLGGAVGAMVSGWIYGESLFLIEAIITLGAFLMLYIHDRRRINELA